jgi:hypothetical protein
LDLEAPQVLLAEQLQAAMEEIRILALSALLTAGRAQAAITDQALGRILGLAE